MVLREQRRSGASLQIVQTDGVGPDGASAQIEHLVSVAFGRTPSRDRGGGLGPFGLAGVERV